MTGNFDGNGFSNDDKDVSNNSSGWLQQWRRWSILMAKVATDTATGVLDADANEGCFQR